MIKGTTKILTKIKMENNKLTMIYLPAFRTFQNFGGFL